ncbi:MAG: sigma-70 family RNA polymerase sigma factor [Ginsengibacter sp.]
MEATIAMIFTINKKNKSLLSAEELIQHIGGCGLNNRESQKKLFSSYYGYAMSICCRYANNQEDAAEILNDGFLKIFKEIHRFVPAYENVGNSFKGWLSKIMVYTAIDHNRMRHRYDSLTSYNGKIIEVQDDDEDALDKISYDEIIKAIQQLSPAYRTIINLFVIDGFSHDEIAHKLGIASGTSKSNLFKAKKQLQKILFNYHQPVLVRNVT